jgi:RecA-family ATPase
MNCTYNPCLDSDVTDPDAAQRIDETVRDWFGDRGRILTRTGNVPKRAYLFRTATPFGKMRREFRDQSGKVHAIEMLGKGQQLVIQGVHPDTGIDYSWNGGTPWEVDSSELPEITEDEVRELMEEISNLLVNELGFEIVEKSGAGNGQVDQQEFREPVGDWDTLLGNMSYHGTEGDGINDTLKRVIPSMLRKATHPNEVLDRCVDAVGAAFARANEPWDRADEIKRVSSSILSGYRMFLKDCAVTSGAVPSWLPGEFHADWLKAISDGKRPGFSRNRGGFGVWAWEPASATGNKKTGAESSKSTKLFVLTPFEPFDLASLPPREWIYGRHYQRRTVSATVAPGGFGKTTLCMVEAVAMATARNLLGEQPTERVRVWYHNGEDSIEELKRRLGAICLHYQIPLWELRGWFFMTSGNEVPLRVANGYGELKIHNELVRCIEDEISRNEIDVAILDPLVTLHGVSEQDNNKMDTVIRIFAAIADAHNCAIELAHHTRKLPVGTSDYVGDDMRGASATKDAVRAARMLNQMTAKDAESAGIQEHERGSYFRVDRVKGNNAPPTKAVWRHFINVDLPNEDEVGVVVSWAFPGQDTPSDAMRAAEKLAEDTFLTLLARFTLQGRKASDRVGVNYAPHVFAREAEAKAAKVSKAALAEAMRRLFKDNRICVEERGSGGKFERFLSATK